MLASACSSSADSTEIKSDLARNTAPDVSAAELDELVAGNTAFALDLYGQVRDEPGNLFMSPYSVSMALAMTYAGAEGDTATQMADALHFTLPADRTHAAFDALDLALASRGQTARSDTIPFRLTTANAMWSQEGTQFETPFLDTLAVNYGAGMHVVDFMADPDGSRQTINQWVADRTNDRIKDLLPQGSVDELTRLVLTNAIYFSGAWQYPFDAGNTADRPFQTPTGTVQVPSLHRSAELRYKAGEGYQVAELPYDGGELGMTLIVPDGDFSSFESSLTPAALADVVTGLQAYDLDLTMPKFEFDTPLSLADALQALGMTDAFSDAADFSGMDGARDLQITGVLHKGFVSVDEDGTEAAAATGVVVGPTAAPEPATLVVDRPFLFLIEDFQTRTILFLGRVVDPR